MTIAEAKEIAEQLLLEEKIEYSNGLYRYTQIELAYHSNRIEGSTLTKEHTSSLFSTNTILAEKDEIIRADDIIEMNNHFAAFRYILHNAEKPLDEQTIKNIHKILLTGTKQAAEDWFNIGEYKKIANCIGGVIETQSPEKVPELMKKLIESYNSTEKTIDDIIAFHAHFEKIHPFQDGNGRTGRLIIFKECLGNGVVPFIIDEQHKDFYIRGLQNYPDIKGHLLDTCLSAQDKYLEVCNKFRLPKEKAE